MGEVPEDGWAHSSVPSVPGERGAEDREPEPGEAPPELFLLPLVAGTARAWVGSGPSVGWDGTGARRARQPRSRPMSPGPLTTNALSPQNQVVVAAERSSLGARLAGALHVYSLDSDWSPARVPAAPADAGRT